MGEIAFANVVSDIYSCGVVDIDELKVILSVPTELLEDEQQNVVAEIIAGFKKSALKANCRLTVEPNRFNINPWLMIGGTATSVCIKNEIIFPTKAEPGDAIILTKPLGVQLATNAPIWMEEESENWRKISEHLSKEDIKSAYLKAVECMTMLNHTAAKLMHKYGAHAATDVTGFGLVGHAENLLSFQKKQLDFVISTLPVIKHVKTIAEVLNRQQKLYDGRMVETSGGLIICLPSDQAESYCDEFKALTGKGCWIIGHVASGSGKVILDNPNIVEV